MKKNTIIILDATHAQVTKAFEKQARIFGTEQYNLWKAYRQDFPDAKMVTKTIIRKLYLPDLLCLGKF